MVNKKEYFDFDRRTRLAYFISLIVVNAAGAIILFEIDIKVTNLLSSIL